MGDDGRWSDRGPVPTWCHAAIPLTTKKPPIEREPSIAEPSRLGRTFGTGPTATETQCTETY